MSHPFPQALAGFGGFLELRRLSPVSGLISPLFSVSALYQFTKMTLNWTPSSDTTVDFLNSLLNDNLTTSDVGQKSPHSTTGFSSQPTTVALSQLNPQALSFSNPSGFGLDTSVQPNLYFDDNFFGDDQYLLSDREVFSSLDPIDDTTLDSPPELQPTLQSNSSTFPLQQTGMRRSTSAMTGTGSSTSSPTQASLRLSNSRSPSSDIAPLDSKDLDVNVENFLDDLTFLKSPLPSASSNTTLETVAEEIDVTTEPTKRPRGNRADFLTACWTSPLCPNNNKEGTPPDPATCGAACGPFLFSDPILPETIDSSLLPQDTETWESIEPIPDTPRPNLKRSGSESTRATGRKASTKSVSSTKTTTIKMENRSSAEAQADETNDGGKGTNDTKARKRQPHNQIERKYRESLNTQLESLRRVVPALQQNRTSPCEGADIEDLPAPSKPSKALILATATAYIKQIEKEKKQVVDENAVLRARVKALQSLVK